MVIHRVRIVAVVRLLAVVKIVMCPPVWIYCYYYCYYGDSGEHLATETHSLKAVRSFWCRQRNGWFIDHRHAIAAAIIDAPTARDVDRSDNNYYYYDRLFSLKADTCIISIFFPIQLEE